MGFLRNMKKLLKYKTCSINHIKLCMWTSEKRKYSKAELCCNSILLRQYPSVQHWQIIFGLKWSSPIWFSQGTSIKVGPLSNSWCFIWRWWVWPGLWFKILLNLRFAVVKVGGSSSILQRQKNNPTHRTIRKRERKKLNIFGKKLVISSIITRISMCHSHHDLSQWS